MLTRAHRRRSIAWVILSLALAAPWTANAVPNRFSKESASRAQVGTRASDRLVALRGWLANLWAEAGCIIDPSGRCIAGTSQNPGGNRGWLANLRAEAGCIADPSGRCI